jgi:hypothetical protein
VVADDRSTGHLLGREVYLHQPVLGSRMQKTGNQTVDDRFTVICCSSDDQVRVLPGFSLETDPRFSLS